jgi:hypothetical protein
VDNLEAADEAKRLVEQGQRERHAAKVESGQEHVAQFFRLNAETGAWEFREEKLKDVEYEMAVTSADENAQTPVQAVGISLHATVPAAAASSSSSAADADAASASVDGETTKRHTRTHTFRTLQHKRDEDGGVEESEDESTTSYSTTATITDELSEPSSDEEDAAAIAGDDGNEEGCVIA